MVSEWTQNDIRVAILVPVAQQGLRDLTPQNISANLHTMKLTAQVKLQTTPEQFAALLKTLETANAACNYISQVAWEHREFNQFRLHHLVYGEIRERFSLTAQVAVRCIAKVADAYQKDRQTKRRFKPHSALAFDDRLLHWYLDASHVSIWTLHGRMRIPFLCGDRQRIQLQLRRGESDLIVFRGHIYLSATCEIDEPIPTAGDDVLGIDLGIANIAVTSDGHVFAGKAINRVRHRHRRLRTKLS
jgi:putative transposase